MGLWLRGQSRRPPARCPSPCQSLAKGVGGTLLSFPLLSCKVARGKSGASYQLLPSWVGGWQTRRQGVGGIQVERVAAREGCGVINGPRQAPCAWPASECSDAGSFSHAQRSTLVPASLDRPGLGAAVFAMPLRGCPFPTCLPGVPSPLQDRGGRDPAPGCQGHEALMLVNRDAHAAPGTNGGLSTCRRCQSQNRCPSHHTGTGDGKGPWVPPTDEQLSPPFACLSLPNTSRRVFLGAPFF